MARRKDKKIDDLVRMTAAVERLEHLVDDADSGILAGHAKTEAVKPDTIVKRRSARVTRPAQRNNLEREIPHNVDSWDARLSVEPKAPPAKPKALSDYVLPTLQAHPRQGESAVLPKYRRGIVEQILFRYFGAEPSALKSALSASLRGLATLVIFSIVIQLLMVAGAVVTMIFFDRAVSTNSFHALAELLVIGLALCGAYAALDLARHRICVRIGDDTDRQVHRAIFETELRSAVQARNSKNDASADLNSLLIPFASLSLLGFLDAACAPLMIAAIFALSMPLGLSAGAASLCFMMMTRAFEHRSARFNAAQAEAHLRVHTFARDLHANAETLGVMGKLATPQHRWQLLYDQWRRERLKFSDRIGTTATTLSAVKILLTILFSTMAASLVLTHALSLGALIAATLLFARALELMARTSSITPRLRLALQHARQLHDVLSDNQTVKSLAHMPRPAGQFEVQKLRLAAPGTSSLIVNGISFNVGPGQMLAITGSSGSGKSTILKALAGRWPIFGGSMMLDGRRIDQGSGDALGQHVGYLAQNQQLMPGSVGENLVAFRRDVAIEDVIKAAEAADAHRFVKKLPSGYDTRIDADGAFLTQGHIQRIALARAYFRTPQILLLDNPDTNLDSAGRRALLSALDDMRKHGQTIILVTQHIDLLEISDSILWLNAGRQRASGSRDDVLKLMHDDETTNAAKKSAHSVGPADDHMESQLDRMSA